MTLCIELPNYDRRPDVTVPIGATDAQMLMQKGLASRGKFFNWPQEIFSFSLATLSYR